MGKGEEMGGSKGPVSYKWGSGRKGEVSSTRCLGGSLDGFQNFIIEPIFPRRVSSGVMRGTTGRESSLKILFKEPPIRLK